ncbi:MAG: hypothetical protein ACLKAK_12925 [Alkaliphilus sp.]
MENMKKENLMMFESSVVFLKKLIRENMINQEEYNAMMKKIKSIYSSDITCIKHTKEI